MLAPLTRSEAWVSEPRSTASSISLGLAYAGIVLVVLGPGIVHLGLAAPMSGFLLCVAGLGLGILAFVTGLVGLVRTRNGVSPGARTRAWAGLGLGAGLAALLLLLVPSARQHPINDVTTSPDAAPVFRAAASDPANRDRELAYSSQLAAVQRRLYPDLAPIELDVATREAFERVQRAADALDWDVRAADPEAGTLEARAVSTLFRFVDDVAVRVRPADGGSIVDVRSKSRDGQSDLGANAQRIRAFAAELGGGPAVSTR